MGGWMDGWMDRSLGRQAGRQAGKATAQILQFSLWEQSNFNCETTVKETEHKIKEIDSKVQLNLL